MKTTESVCTATLKKLIAAFVIAGLAFAPFLSAQNSAADSDPQTHGINVANMDRTVKPGDDFFEYANGAWLKRTEIPPDRGSVGIFSVLADKSLKRVQGLVEEATKANAPAGSETRKVADLYSSYMNETAIEKRGLSPLKPHLDAIAKISDKKQLAYALGETLRADVDALNNTNFHTANLFGLWVAPGFSDSEHYVPYLLQGGLQMPNREYYIASGEHMEAVRTKYKAHVSAMLKLAGFDETDTRAARIYDLEHAIAEKQLSLAENNDVHKANNLWTRADFSAKAPGLDWNEYFRGAKLDKQQNFMVWQPSAFTAESALVESVSLDAWKDWLAYHQIEAYGGVLPKAIADERFAFFGQVLGGTPQQRPREQRAVLVVNLCLGDAVGKVYAKRYFPASAKAQVDAMVTALIEAFRKRIDALTWMDPRTKAEAKEKLKTLYVGIGYTEHWLDYSAYEVKADDAYGNLERADLFTYHSWLARLGGKVDRRLWTMYPQTVNAVNLPLQNALNFPAAILEPPFFDPKAPAAVNFGAIGSVIGHEISHTFDSEGAAFDAKGALRNWWTDADLAHFKQATAMLAAQYDAYKPFPDLALKGEQTLAENIADVAGLLASYDGYHASLSGKETAVEEGFSGDQQFFISYAQQRGSKSRDAALRQQILTDPHSPSKYRALTVRNLDAWYPAFDVKPGEKLYLAPDERVRIW
jgi:putative endopeptidase